jgi:hypothetical protein
MSPFDKERKQVFKSFYYYYYYFFNKKSIVI